MNNNTLTYLFFTNFSIISKNQRTSFHCKHAKINKNKNPNQLIPFFLIYSQLFNFRWIFSSKSSAKMLRLYICRSNLDLYPLIFFKELDKQFWLQQGVVGPPYAWLGRKHVSRTVIRYRSFQQLYSINMLNAQVNLCSKFTAFWSNGTNTILPIVSPQSGRTQKY